MSRYNYTETSTFNRQHHETPELQRVQPLDQPCRHPVDLRSSYLRRGKRWQRCTVCGAERFGCGAWDRTRLLSEVEREAR